MNMGIRTDNTLTCTDFFSEAFVTMPTAVLSGVIHWILTRGAAAYGSVFVVCGKRDTEHYSESLYGRYAKLYSRKKAYCITADEFKLQQARIEAESILKEYLNDYADADLLVITRGERMGKTQKAQKEMLSVFNRLAAEGKQLVVFSSVPPRCIPGIQPGLLEYLEGSLIIEL